MSELTIAKARARIVTAPFTMWLAPAGTEPPKLSTEESSFVTAATAWTKLGESGDKNYSEAGVTVTHSETIAQFQPAGSTVPRKAWRTDEGIEMAGELADLNPEQYALILDNATVTHASGGIAGTEPFAYTFKLYRGSALHFYAVLLRGPGSVEETRPMQYWFPFCYQAANQTPKFALKGGPALLAFQFTAMELESEKFGEIQIASAT